MKQPLVKLDNIEMDTSIQCRAVIDTATVSEYADRMMEGDKFPAVVMFEENGKLWIGDGWHRVMAARQMGAVDIAADVRQGGRKEALQYALGANAANGLRRSNADKRRCVEIALAEFGGLSDNAIGKMCGVDNHTVKAARPVTLGNSQPEPRTGADGKKYPARRTPATEQDETDEEVDKVRQAAIEAEEERYTANGTTPDPMDRPKGKANNNPDEVYSSETITGLKRYWKQANKKERKTFLEWTKHYAN